MKTIKWMLALLLACLYSATAYADILRTKADYKSMSMGTIYIYQDIDPDELKKELKEKAKSGNAMAQFYLGKEYSGGFFNDKPNEKSLPWFQKSAKQGYIDAMKLLANAYKKGYGVKKSENLAKSWSKKIFLAYKKLAEHGDKEAQFQLAEAYAKGLGVEKNSKQTYHWLETSAKNGYPKAASEMGRYHVSYMFALIELFSDTGVSPNFSTGMYWYNKAGKAYEEEALEVKKEVQDSMRKAQVFLKQEQLGKSYDALSRAWNRNYMPAYYMKAVILLNGYTPKYMENNPKLSKSTVIINDLTKASEAGMPQAQFELAKFYMQKGNGEKASKWFYSFGKAALRARNKNAVATAIQGLTMVHQKLRYDRARAMSQELQMRSSRL